MKKIIPLLLLTTLLLAGCLGVRQNPAETDNVQQEEAENTVRPSAETGVSEAVPAPSPSFSDGDYYLQALTKKDKSLCEKISDGKLKERCRGEAVE